MIFPTWGILTGYGCDNPPYPVTGVGKVASPLIMFCNSYHYDLQWLELVDELTTRYRQNT